MRSRQYYVQNMSIRKTKIVTTISKNGGGSNSSSSCCCCYCCLPLEPMASQTMKFSPVLQYQDWILSHTVGLNSDKI